jgi:hypothetical protein
VVDHVGSALINDVVLVLCLVWGLSPTIKSRRKK